MSTCNPADHPKHRCRLRDTELHKNKPLLYTHIVCCLLMMTSGLAFSGYDVYTVDIESLSSQLVQANYNPAIHYDFSEIVGDSQVIERVVFSMTGNFTPGTGIYFVPYETEDGTVYETVHGQLPSAGIDISNFDGEIDYGIQFPNERSQFTLGIDSEVLVGRRRYGTSEPYPGYSKAISGSFDFSFGQSISYGGTIETWPTIDITKATFTLYVIPEPATVGMLGIGGLILKKQRKTNL